VMFGFGQIDVSVEKFDKFVWVESILAFDGFFEICLARATASGWLASMIRRFINR
jgi:hypothetical protein